MGRGKREGRRRGGGGGKCVIKEGAIELLPGLEKSFSLRMTTFWCMM